MQRRQFLQSLNVLGASSLLFTVGGHAANGTVAPATGAAALLTPAPKQAALHLEQLRRGLLNPVFRPDWYSIDVEDLRNILSHKGDCAFGFGSAHSAVAAALIAIDHPLLGQHRLNQASAVLMVVRAPPRVLMLRDAINAMKSIRKQLSRDAMIIHGTHFEVIPDNQITVAVLASGIHAIRHS